MTKLIYQNTLIKLLKLILTPMCTLTCGYIRKFLINNLKSLFISFVLITPSILIFINCIIYKGNKSISIAIHNSWKEFKDVMQ